jgi:hypothetical protein
MPQILTILPLSVLTAVISAQLNYPASKAKGKKERKKE